MSCNGRRWQRLAAAAGLAEINADADDWRREAMATLEQGLPEDARSNAATRRWSWRDAHLRLFWIAQEEHAGLIVMGVQSRGTIDPLLFGSTTREVNLRSSVSSPVDPRRQERPAWVFAADIAQLRVGA